MSEHSKAIRGTYEEAVRSVQIRDLEKRVKELEATVESLKASESAAKKAAELAILSSQCK